MAIGRYAVLLLNAFLLVGCVETGGGGTASDQPSSAVVTKGKTSQEVALEKKIADLNSTSKNIIARNTMQGAAVGAVAGCGLALLLGGDGGDCAAGAVAGGVVGGVGGNVAGQQAADANAEIVRLDQAIARLQRVNSELGTIETQLSSVVRSQNTEIASLRRQLDGKQVTPAAYQARVSAINSNRRSMSNSLKISQDSVADAAGELRSAQAQGQQGLDGAQQSAVATQNRIAKLRESISLLPTN